MTHRSRTILVTGGTGKLGRLIIDGFALQGDVIVTTTRQAKAATKLCDRWLQLGAAAVHLIEADLSAQEGITSVLNQVTSKGLAPHVLVNNARNLANVRPDQGGRLTHAQWAGEFSLGVIAPYELSIELARASSSMLRSIVNVASMYGVIAANPNLYANPKTESPVNYGVVKAGLIHLTRELAVRLAPSIRVNSVSFGGVEGRADDAFVERYARLCPTGRMLRENEVFEPVRFLSDDASSGVTGHNLIVDGGWSAW